MNKEEQKHLMQSYYNLHEEYYKLKSMLFQSIDNTNKAINLYKLYQDRNEKAIEFINTNYFITGRIKDLLNILQNGSDNDDK